ncbi:hypothetical protein Tco_1109123 [Tanacetum coccineum]
MGLWYPKDSGFELIAYSDADHAGCKDDCKITSGGLQFLEGKLVSWSSKKRDCTTMSTAEVEYVSLSACCAQVIWMRTQLLDYGYKCNRILMYCDSKSAIAISCNPVQHSKTKHIDIRYHFIKEHVEKGTVEIYFVGTEYQLADLFTKALPKERFEYLVHRIAEDIIKFQDNWSSAAMENVMQDILQMLDNTCHWMGSIVIADKIIVSHYMTIFPDISRRARDKYHNLQDDDIMKNIFNSGRYKDKVGMQIPAWMITEEMKHTKHYRMYAEGVSISLGQPNLKETAESSAPRRSTVIRLHIPERRSTRLTPPASVPNVDKADAMILQDIINEHLASEEIEKMVDGQENVVDDSSIHRNDESNIPGTRIEPGSKKGKSRVNINDEDEEKTDEVYELKRREKGKLWSEIRNSPIINSPTPIRSPRIHTNLVSSDTEKLQELTDTHTTSSSSLPHPKFMPRKSFDTLADNLHDVMVETLPTMVDKHIKKQVMKQVPKQVRNKVPVYVAKGLILERQKAKEETERLIAKAILQERVNIQAQILTQIKNAIANVIPSQVDASYERHMSWTSLQCSSAQSQTSSVPEQQYQLYLAMKANPRLVTTRTLSKSMVGSTDEGRIVIGASGRRTWSMKYVLESHPLGQVLRGKAPYNFRSDFCLGRVERKILSLHILRKTSPLDHDVNKDPEAPAFSQINQDLLFIRSTVIWERVHDFQLGIESYQQKVNLTAPTMTFPGIEDHEMFSIIYEPVHGIIYKNSKKEKRVMRHSEIHKFCDATLNRVLKGLKSYNNDIKYGYVQKDLTKDEAEYLKLFEEEIKERLKHRRQMRR